VSGAIWAVAQHRDGKLHRGAWEAVAAARHLASELGATAEAIVLGDAPDALAGELAKADLATVRTITAPGLAGYTPGGYVGALSGAIREAAPRLVLLPHTYQSSEYAPRLAHAVEAALVVEATGYESADGSLTWKRPVVGGKLQARVRVRSEGTAIVTLQSGAFSADDRGTGSAPIEALTASGAAPDREILGVEQAASETVDLSRADTIVAIGRGIGGGDKMEGVQALAKRLGAEMGASRPVIDSDWLPRDRQIGSSGQTVAPKLYVALGISGAIQHLVGMKGAGCVVAINKDAGAPIFKVARYGWVGDLHEFVPAFLAALGEEGS